MTAYMNYSKKNKDEDDMSLADIMSLKISTTPIVEEKNEWNDWSIHNEVYQKQLQSSYYQLQYLQQQQMLMMMNNNSSRRSSTISSATSTSSNSSRYYYPQYYPISPSSSSTSSSIKHSKPRTNNRSSIPVEINTSTPPKRRQSLGKRIKKVFGMTETSLPAEIPNDKTLGPTKITNNNDSSNTKRKANNNVTMANNILTTKMPDSPNSSISSRRQHYYRHSNNNNALPSPASSTVSTNSIKTNNTNNTTTIKKKKSLAFNSVIKVHETFSASEYDRRCDTSATCQKLTPVLALKIKEELNHFKLNDMFIHADSRKNTHFFM